MTPLTRTPQGLGGRLTARTTAVVVGVALLGGGAALAAPGLVGGEGTGSSTAEPSEDDTSRDLLAEHCETEGGATDPFCSGPSDQDPPDDTPTDPEDPDLDDDRDPARPDDRAARNDTAERVHRALTGGDELRPGDPGFGQAIASRACSGQLGAVVSRAARGEELTDQDLALAPCEHRGRASDARAPADDGEVADGAADEAAPSGDEVPDLDAAETAERAAPPRGVPGHARSEGRGGPAEGDDAGQQRAGPPSHAGGNGRGDGAPGQGRGRG